MALETTITMPPLVNAAVIEALHAAALQQRGTALTIDASELASINTQTIQFLLACDAEWKASGQVLNIQGSTAALSAALERLGIGSDVLSLAESQSCP